MRLVWALTLGLASPAEAFLRIKFQHWFPKYEQHWIEASEHCGKRLNDYFQDNRTDCDTPCACAADCLLQNVTGTIQTNFGSAQVLLGLLPTALMFASPNIEEIAVLSTYRPALAVLAATGSSSTRVTRLFSTVNISEPLHRPASKALLQWAKLVNRQHPTLRTVLRALSYFGAIAAIANNVRTSIHLDLRTISGWRCGALMMPLGWSLCGIVVHIPGQIAIRARLGADYRWYPPSLANSKTYQRVVDGTDAVVPDTLLALTTLFAILQLIFGTLILSSLVFISAFEAVQVFGLYALSTVTVQSVVLLEMAYMKENLAHAGTTA